MIRSASRIIARISKPIRRPVSTFKRGVYGVYKLNPKHRRKSVSGIYDLTVLALLIVAIVIYNVI